MHVIKNKRLEEQDDAGDFDYELPTSNQLWSNNINLIPMQNTVQSARLFYGARFFNQAMPLEKGEAPLVQAATDDDPNQSFEELMGGKLGALKADEDGEVEDADDNRIVLKTAAGKRVIPLHKMFPFNRKSGIWQKPVVAKGDKISKGQLIARSNYTDDQGRLATGVNARIALVPFKGESMDDALVISEGLAKRMTSEHVETHEQQYDDDVLGGREHFSSLFPKKYTRDQLGSMDDNGVVKPGTILRAGDPIFLATRPRSFNSATASLGNLSRTVRLSRSDASSTWDSEDPAEVVRVVKGKHGFKVVTRALHPARVGDKLVLRPGAKGIVSDIIPDDRMPRTGDGKPLDMLLNHLSLPSRVNSETALELWLGKIAAKTGQPFKAPAFNKRGDDWVASISKMLEENGLTAEEEVFDPALNRKLDAPVTVGNGYALKLHHVAASKTSARGQAGYDSDLQPARGGGDNAQSKRRSGLEVGAMLSSGAYANLREGATLSGSRNDDFWRTWRSGGSPKMPGKPFVWDKYLALLQGAGMRASDKGAGVLRLGPMTDRHVDELDPLEIKDGTSIDMNTLEPKPGGLFDTALSSTNRWGFMTLPRPVPNPAFEDGVRQLLGLTKAEFDAVLDGEKTLEEVQGKPAIRRPQVL